MRIRTPRECQSEAWPGGIMPTDEFRPLLNRAHATEHARQLIELACPLLREVVNKATRAFHLCVSEGARIGDENEGVRAFTAAATRTFLNRTGPNTTTMPLPTRSTQYRPCSCMSAASCDVMVWA